MTTVAARPGAAGPRRGLSQVEATLRLRRDGPNVLPVARGPSPVVALLAEMTHFFAVMLWIAAGLAVLAGMPQLGAAIAVVVVLNGVFAFIQEWRADQAGRRLQDLLPARVVVRRDGRRTVVQAPDLVVGDVVLLTAGDRVCADVRLLRSYDVQLDESMLTGESVPLRRGPHEAAFAGTFVVEGEGEAVVEATGGRTRLAGIAALTRAGRRPRSPLAKRLDTVVRVVAVTAVATGAAFFGLALLLGSPVDEGFLFGVGVTVALVPEGLLPTVTLSLARAAQRMAAQHALVRHLEAVETLGATTFVCTDKTGTLTRNEMSVVEVWTPRGSVRVHGGGYAPVGRLVGDPVSVELVRRAALVAVRCSAGRVVRRGEEWRPQGDPMEVALHVLALRGDVDVDADEREHPARRRFPFDPRRRRMSVVTDNAVLVKGAPDAVLPRCATGADGVAAAAASALGDRGLRVLAVASRPADGETPAGADHAERDLELLALVGIEDPPRDGVASALADFRRAAVRVAMVTGDAAETARAIGRETGLVGSDELVVVGADLPADERELGELLDRDGVVVARVTPEDKQRIAHALQARGHVVAMTGDGVNDGPALKAADIGVAMGRSGTDVAREAADLVLLDDHIATMVAAIAQGRATFSNIRRFLTYHLTDNVAELTPFVVWALSGGHFPLALGVLQVLALDIGTDLLPALALGAEPPSRRVLDGPARSGGLVDGRLLRRVFAVLGPTEALVEMAAFTVVLVLGGWTWAATPSADLLAVGSGTAFTAVVLGQVANAFACRSETRWIGAKGLRGNSLLFLAVGLELAMLAAFLAVPWLAHLLGGSVPSPEGWALAALAIPAVVLADAAHKAVRGRRPPVVPTGGSPRRRSRAA